MTILRIFLAIVLAVLVMPTANNLSPDQDVTVTPPFSAAVLADLDQHIAQAAGTFGIAVPTVRFVTSKAAGVTTQSPDSSKKEPEIRLGRPLQRAAYHDRPDLLKAVASHEFGHAVMLARHDDFPLWSILVMYATGLLPFLAVLPKIISVFAGGSLMVLVMSVMMLFPKWAIAHDAYLFFLVGLSTLSLLILALDFAKLLDNSFGRWLKPFLPSAKIFGIAGLVAFPLFQMSCYLVGQMNIERELRADAFGACLTSPATMREALLALTDVPPSSAKEAFDTFHPSMKERTAILGTLEQEPLKSRTCAALLSGKEPIVIDGHVIQ